MRKFRQKLRGNSSRFKDRVSNTRRVYTTKINSDSIPFRSFSPLFLTVVRCPNRVLKGTSVWSQTPVVRPNSTPYLVSEFLLSEYFIIHFFFIYYYIFDHPLPFSSRTLNSITLISFLDPSLFTLLFGFDVFYICVQFLNTVKFTW